MTNSCATCPWLEAHRPHITEVSKKAALEGAWFVCIEDYRKCRGVDWYVKEHWRNRARYEKDKAQESDKEVQNLGHSLFSSTGGYRVGAVPDGDEAHWDVRDSSTRDVY